MAMGRSPMTRADDLILTEGETVTDSFVYTVTDSSGVTDMAVVSIDITGVAMIRYSVSSEATAGDDIIVVAEANQRTSAS